MASIIELLRSRLRRVRDLTQRNEALEARVAELEAFAEQAAPILAALKKAQDEDAAAWADSVN